MDFLLFLKQMIFRWKKTEQSKQTDSDFLKQICEKYGLVIRFTQSGL